MLDTPTQQLPQQLEGWGEAVGAGEEFGFTIT